MSLENPHFPYLTSVTAHFTHIFLSSTKVYLFTLKIALILGRFSIFQFFFNKKGSVLDPYWKSFFIYV